jgi:hypothetical protein
MAARPALRAQLRPLRAAGGPGRALDRERGAGFPGGARHRRHRAVYTGTKLRSPVRRPASRAAQRESDRGGAGPCRRVTCRRSSWRRCRLTNLTSLTRDAQGPSAPSSWDVSWGAAPWPPSPARAPTLPARPMQPARRGAPGIPRCALIYLDLDVFRGRFLGEVGLRSPIKHPLVSEVPPPMQRLRPCLCRVTLPTASEVCCRECLVAGASDSATSRAPAVLRLV